jgi:DNA repair protein SbcD/Mre11
MNMKVLHTADWHLGKKLEQYERTEEFQCFLDWLIDFLSKECIDVLIVSGDIFDSGTPSNTALEQYYSFLRRVKDTCCREVIIVGGNHDSISTLNAPRTLLKYFNVHIIGGVPEDFTEQIIPLKDAAGQVELVICAVPFLRDKDIRLSIPGETSDEREARIKQGIYEHYHRFVSHIGPYKKAGIPVIATGHLFSAGSSTSDSEKEIHMGSLGKISGDRFPVEFDYIALGHIHRPQMVNKMEHIRYSGSPIPLSFSESENIKQVIILESKAGVLKIEPHEVPVTRKLIRIKGDLATVKKKVYMLEDPGSLFPAWVEIQLETPLFIHDLEEQLSQLKAKKTFIERFFIRQIKVKPVTSSEHQADEILELADLDPKEVFLKKFKAEYGDGDYTGLLRTYEEALQYMPQKEE